MTRPRGRETVFMPNLVEHEILNAHMYINIKNHLFSGSYKPGKGFFLLIKVKMPTIVGNCLHFNFYEQEKFHAQLS